ncbi:MAG: isoamylase early set domain-containing protein [Actinomycetota bacterium]|nr:isoamylase early set domain-containing protein [Actinomycetota bacterium]
MYGDERDFFMIKLTSSRGNGKVKASFVLPVTETREPVSVLGDFNQWDPMADPLKKRANGTRSASVELEPGQRYTFKYLSEGGTWFTEPQVSHQVNEYGETNSVIHT